MPRFILDKMKPQSLPDPQKDEPPALITTVIEEGKPLEDDEVQLHQMQKPQSKDGTDDDKKNSSNSGSTTISTHNSNSDTKNDEYIGLVTKTAIGPKPQKVTPADRSKALAQSRILLNEAITSLVDLCTVDRTKKDIQYHGCIVETSKSQKIWKPDFVFPPATDGSGASGQNKKSHGFNYHLKYDSTIEQNDDFKKFIDNRIKMEEERKNRPKPAPGGTSFSSTVTSSTNAANGLSFTPTGDSDVSKLVNGENGEPIAALVLHLREKDALKRKSKIPNKSSNNSRPISGKGESSKKSSKKKGAKKASESTSGNKAGGAGGKNTSSSQNDASKKKKKKKRKKKNKAAQNVAPSMILMKPGSK